MMSGSDLSGLLANLELEDVGITQGQFNIGQQLLSLGIVLWYVTTVSPIPNMSWYS